MPFVFISYDSESGQERKRRLMIESTIYALEKYKGNKTKAALYLGISLRCLVNRVRDHAELTRYKKERNINSFDEDLYYDSYSKQNLWRRNGN